MKLLYVGHTYTVRANQAKIAALARLPGIELTLLTPHAWKGPLYHNQTDPANLAGVDHQVVRAYGVGKEGAYIYGNEALRLILDLKPDIVHVEQGAYALSYSQILFGLKRLSRDSKATFFTWWNLPYEKKGLKRLSEKFNLDHSACAVAGNEAAKSILLGHGFDRPVFVLPQLGVELADYSFNMDDARREKAGRVRWTIGYIGRITKEKGVLDLVKAVAGMSNREGVELYFVGTGDALLECKRLAASLDVRLIHQASVKNHEVPGCLALIDVLVLPSRTTPEWVEQFGHILLEGMAAGVPVLGSSSGEIPEVIGDAGLVFPEGDTSILAGMLDSLYDDPNRCNALATAGRERVANNFTHDKIAARQAEIYDWMFKEGLSVGELSGHLKVAKPHTKRVPE